jgi:hypothetical protein
VRLSIDFCSYGRQSKNVINPLNTELNPICYLLALLGSHHILHISRIRVNVDFAKLGTNVVPLKSIRRGASDVLLRFTGSKSTAKVKQ